MIVIACVSSTIANKSSQLDFKLWFLPQISTDAIQTALDVKLFLCSFKWTGSRAINMRDKSAELKCGASLSFLK